MKNVMSRQDLPQKDLLALAARGDKQAFGHLYEQYLKEIYCYVYYRLGDPLDSEDITETVFLRAWEHLPKIYAGGSQVEFFRAWLYRIAKNLIADHFRARPTQPLEDDRPNHADLGPEKTAERRILVRSLARALKRLEPTQQQVIILRFINRLDHNKTAQILGLSPSHVRVLQHRALQRLRSILKEE